MPKTELEAELGVHRGPVTKYCHLTFAELAALAPEQAKAVLLERAEQAYRRAMDRSSQNKKGETVSNPDMHGAMHVMGFVAQLLGLMEHRQQKGARKKVADLAAEAPWLQKETTDG
jgi:hypothetical protein